MVISSPPMRPSSPLAFLRTASQELSVREKNELVAKEEKTIPGWLHEVSRIDP
jgi:hypothetical protein